MSVLSDLRGWMAQENLDYFLVSSTDEYLNEYIPLEQNGRYFITGFKGSAGDVLVGADDAHLFVDGRYHKQADDEVYPSLINVVKLNLGQTQREAICDILKSKNEMRVGIISSKISYYAFCELKKELPKVEFVEYKNDIVLELGKIPSQKKFDRAKKIDLKMAGLNSDKKLQIIQNDQKEDFFIITKLDEIAYLTNLRTYEMAYSSSIKAKAIIDKQKCVLFTNHKVNKIGDNFMVRPEEEFFEYLKILQGKFLISTTSINLQTFRAVENFDLTKIKTSPIAKMKAIKNQSEIKHLKKCFKKTDRIIVKIQKWLNKRSNKTEMDLSKKVEKYFKRKWAKALSFKTIAATGANSAIVHYSNPSDKIIKNDMVLVDCGAYFKGGYATDITQTFFVGHQPSHEQKKVYTTVMKAFLAGVNFKLTEKSTGQDLDKTVRNVIEKNPQEGFVFSHSTGHGVGICVHENPPFITSSKWGEDILEPGMCFSIEPGLYKDNSFGVRIERVVYIDKNSKIIPLSKAPMDEKLIDYDMLSEQEKTWLNSWQKG